MKKLIVGLCILLLQTSLIVSRQSDFEISFGRDWLQNIPQNCKQSMNKLALTSSLTISRTQGTQTTSIPMQQPQIKQQAKQQPAQNNKIKASTTAPEVAKNNQVFQQQAEKLLVSGGQYFQEDISGLYEAVYQAAESGLLDHPQVNNQLIHEAVRLLVHQGKVEHGVIKRNRQCCWFDKHDISDASAEDQVMINYMMTRIHGCSNDAVIELAQGCLRAWSQAQDVLTVQEYDIYKKVYDFCYTALYNHAQFELAAYGAQPVQKQVLQDLLSEYNDQLDMVDQTDDVHYNRLIHRQHYAQESLKNPDLNDYTLAISPQAIGFMMAHDINYASFQNKNCLQFQHYLSTEVVGIIESIADLAMKHHSSALNDFFMHTCALAVCGQQFNQQSHIKQAVALVDLCHFFGKFVVDAGDLLLGFSTGCVRGLDAWVRFGCKLYEDPKKTMGKVIEGYYDIGCMCAKLCKHIGDVVIFDQLDEMTQEVSECLKNRDPYQAFQLKRSQRLQRRKATIKDDIEIVAQATQVLFDTFSQKSWHEVFSDCGEIVVDSFISAKITDALSYTAQFVGSATLQAALQLEQVVPDDLLHSSLQFVQQGGELIAVVEETGEQVTSIVTALHMAAKKAGKIAGGVAAAKSAADKLQPEPKYGTPEWDTKYPNGKYERADYHPEVDKDGNPIKNSLKANSKKSPAPYDGQAALDRSLSVEGTDQRVTTENGKIVILKHEGNGIYHGYLVEDFHSIDNGKVRKVLLDAGLVKSAKSGKIIK